MKSVYENNLDALSNRYGQAYASELENTCITEEITAEVSPKGYPVMKIKLGDRESYICSKYDPLKEAERFVGSIEEYDAETLFIIYGLGLGYHIEELINSVSENNKILILEPDWQVFKKANELVDLQKIISNPNIFILVGNSSENVVKILWAYINASNANNFQFLPFSNYNKVFNDFYNEVTKVLKEHVMTVQVLLSTVSYFSYDYNKNMFSNIASILESSKIQDLENKFKNVPAVIVSAGPSLDKNIKELKAAKGKALILSGGRTVKALLENGIEPDIVFSIDAGDIAYDTLQGKAENDFPLITTVISSDKVVEAHRGKKMYMNVSEYKGLVDYLGDREIDTMLQGGSVANTMLSCAKFMGCNPVIFIGQDLAYTDKKVHAVNSTITGHVNDVEKGTLEVEDINGNTVQTSKVFLSFLRWFEMFIESNSDIKYIDATEGGAKIKGTEITTLKECIQDYCVEDLNIEERVKELFEGEPADSKVVDECIGKLKEIKRDLEKVRRNCDRGIGLCQKMIDHYEKGTDIKIGKLLNTLEKVDKSILRYKYCNHSVTSLISPSILRVELSKEFAEPMNEKDNAKGARLGKKTMAIYQAIRDVGMKIPDMIDNCIKKLEKMKGDAAA